MGFVLLYQVYQFDVPSGVSTATTLPQVVIYIIKLSTNLTKDNNEDNFKNRQEVK